MEERVEKLRTAVEKAIVEAVVDDDVFTMVALAGLLLDGLVKAAQEAVAWKEMALALGWQPGETEEA